MNFISSAIKNERKSPDKDNYTMQRSVKLFSHIVIFFTSSSFALAFCVEPTGGFIETPVKPSVPWCVNEWDNTHTCDDWVISNYYDELSNYQAEVEYFITRLNSYVDEAVEYAQCRAAELE